MAKDFQDFVALYKSDECNERINGLVKELAKNDVNPEFTMAKAQEHRCVAILREYHDWLSS